MTAYERISRSAEQLQARIEEHRRLLVQAADADGAVEQSCLDPDCPHRRQLRQTLLETVRILEETRRAFKSKQIEILRKKLIGVLAEDA